MKVILQAIFAAVIASSVQAQMGQYSSTRSDDKKLKDLISLEHKHRQEKMKAIADLKKVSDDTVRHGHLARKFKRQEAAALREKISAANALKRYTARVRAQKIAALRRQAMLRARRQELARAKAAKIRSLRIAKINALKKYHARMQRRAARSRARILARAIRRKKESIARAKANARRAAVARKVKMMKMLESKRQAHLAVLARRRWLIKRAQMSKISAIKEKKRLAELARKRTIRRAKALAMMRKRAAQKKAYKLTLAAKKAHWAKVRAERRRRHALWMKKNANKKRALAAKKAQWLQARALRRYKHAVNLRKHKAYKKYTNKRNKAYRRAIAKKAGISKRPRKVAFKKPCAKKPSLVASTINVVVINHKVAK